MDLKHLINNRDSRSSRLAKNVLASFFIKGWNALVVLMMVPLTLKMLGDYNNGIWLTISSMLMWIDMMDIGLGNGMRNAVATYVAQNDSEKVRQVVSSTLAMLVLVVIPILSCLLLSICFGDTYGFLGVSPDRLANLNEVLVVAAVMMCMTFVMKFIGNFYMGFQQPAMNNLLLSLGQTIAFIGTLIAYCFGSCSLFTVVAINVIAPLLVWILAYPYTFIYKYPQYRPSGKNVDLKVAANLCATGLQFFVIQICTVILFTSSNVIISHFISPAEVTPYQVAYRYFSIMLVFFTIVCMPFWNATTDAYASGDIDWIRKASHKLNLMLVGILFGLCLMVAVSTPIYIIWVGSEVHVPMTLSVSMALYLFILIVSMRYSYFLNGIGVLRIQIICTSLATICFLPLAWWVCEKYHSVTGLVLVMCLVNIPGLIANVRKFNKLIYNK